MNKAWKPTQGLNTSRKTPFSAINNLPGRQNSTHLAYVITNQTNRTATIMAAIETRIRDSEKINK